MHLVGIGYAARNERGGGRQCARVFEMECTLQTRRETERDSDARAYRVVLETMQLEIQLKLYGYGYITTSANGSTQTPKRSIDGTCGQCHVSLNRFALTCVFSNAYLQDSRKCSKKYEKLRFGIRTNFMYTPSSLSRNYARFQKSNAKPTSDSIKASSRQGHTCYTIMSPHICSVTSLHSCALHPESRPPPSSTSSASLPYDASDDRFTCGARYEQKRACA